MKYKQYCKVSDHCQYTGEYRAAVHKICNLKYSVPKKTPIAFHYGFNYDYHFIIKELAVPIEKEVTRIDKHGKETIKNVSYILQSIDSARFIASSLSSLVNSLSEGIHKIKCKY